METVFIYRYDLSSVVFPSIEDDIKKSGKLNLISGRRLREEFLSGDTELAHKINECINNGELIPKELWIPFFTALWDNDKINVFCGLVNEISQFKLFEEHFKARKIKIKGIQYYRITEVEKVLELAVKKYGKVYQDNTELLARRIEEHDKKIMDICDYSRIQHVVSFYDYFEKEIEIKY